MKAHLLAVICEVYTKVHEVILSPARLVDDPLQHSLVNFVWDIPKHYLVMSVEAQQARRELTVVRTSIPSRIRLISTWL